MLTDEFKSSVREQVLEDLEKYLKEVEERRLEKVSALDQVLDFYRFQVAVGLAIDYGLIE